MRRAVFLVLVAAGIAAGILPGTGRAKTVHSARPVPVLAPIVFRLTCLIGAYPNPVSLPSWLPPTHDHLYHLLAVNAVVPIRRKVRNRRDPGPRRGQQTRNEPRFGLPLDGNPPWARPINLQVVLTSNVEELGLANATDDQVLKQCIVLIVLVGHD